MGAVFGLTIDLEVTDLSKLSQLIWRCNLSKLLFWLARSCGEDLDIANFDLFVERRILWVIV